MRMPQRTVTGIPLVVLAAVWTASAQPTPSGSWSFDEPGEQIADAAGNGLDGEAPNCGRAAGHAGQALKVDGNTGMFVPDSPLLRGDRGFTLECWIKSDAPPGPAMNIVSKANEFMVRVDPEAAGGTISFFAWTEDTGWEPRARGPRLEPGRWYHLIASWDWKTLRFTVNREFYQSSKPGICPRTEAPLAVGGPAEGLNGFRGLIDEVRVYSAPVGPIRIMRMAYGLAGTVTGKPLREAHFDFANGLQGWTAQGDASVRDENGALRARLNDREAYLLVRGLAVDAEQHPFCNVRLSATAGTRGVLLFVSDKAIKEVPFRLIADGAMRAYTAHCAGTEPWAGTIEAMGLSIDGCDVTNIAVDSLDLHDSVAVPPDVRILSLAPKRRIGGLDKPMPVTCWVENRGGTAQGIELALSCAGGIRVAGDSAQRVAELGFGERAEVEWTVRADEPTEGEVRVALGFHGGQVAAMVRPVSFARDAQRASVELFRSRAWQRAGFPKSMDFRHLWSNSVGFLEHNTAFLVDFSVAADGKAKIPAAIELKQRYPDRLVLMQVNDETNGIWGSWHVVPREFAVKEGLTFDPVIFPMPEFRGYWLLGPGATLTRDFPAEAETIEVRVPDTKLLRTEVWGHTVLRDVLLYRRVNGRPDWSQSEYASVTKIDEATGTVTLQRWPKDAVGQWRAFAAGETYLAPSVGSIYRAEQTGKWVKTWIPNLTKFCPRDPATGMDATTWWARHFANLWHTRIAASEPHPDGLQFDGLAESPWSDCDNDGVVDGCFVGGVNYWTLGLYDFFRKVRTGDGFPGMGDGLILSDASNVWGVRFPGVLNGSENEEFPSFAGAEYFSTGMDLYRTWCNESAAPSCPYVQGRFHCDTYLEHDYQRIRQAGKFHGDSLVRLSIAAACMGEGIYTFRTGGKRDRAQIATGNELLEYPWDEYHAGVEGRYNWLGQPLGEAVRLTDHLGPDLLRDAAALGGWSLEASSDSVRAEGPAAVSLEGRPGVEVNVVAIDSTRQPRPHPRTLATQATLFSPETTEALSPDKEYSVEFMAQADPQYDELEGQRFRGVMRWIEVCLRGGGRDGIPQSVLVGDEPRHVALTLRHPASVPCQVAFRCGAELGPVRLADVHVRVGCAEVFARRFERGLALANGSSVSPFTFDVSELGAGCQYRRFLGRQAPEINDGQSVGNEVTLPPQDGILLTVAE